MLVVLILINLLIGFIIGFLFGYFIEPNDLQKYLSKIKSKINDVTNDVHTYLFAPEYEQVLRPNSSLKECNPCVFSFVGDVGMTDDSRQTIDNIMRVNPDAIFFAGDLSYTTPDDWFEFTKELDKTKVFPAMGNHEVGRDSHDVYYSPHQYWLAPYNQTNTYYSVSNDFIKVIIIDTELLEQNKYDEFQRQKQFVIDELDGNTSDFEVIVMHRPFYSDIRVVTEYRNQLQPLFDKYEVEVVIQAHNHNYQRYDTISFNGTADVEGQLYLGVGTGGRNLYASGDFVEHKIFGIKEAGILLLEITNSSATGKFVTNENKILDEFHVNIIESQSLGNGIKK